LLAIISQGLLLPAAFFNCIRNSRGWLPRVIDVCCLQQLSLTASEILGVDYPELLMSAAFSSSLLLADSSAVHFCLRIY